MQDHTADELYAVMFHTEHSLTCLTDGGESFGEQIVQGFSRIQSFSEFSGLVTQLCITHGLHGRTQGFDLVHDGIDSFKLALAVCTKYFFGKFHTYAPIIKG